MNSFPSAVDNPLLALCAAVGEPIFISNVLEMAPEIFDGPSAVQTTAAQAGSQIHGDGVQVGYAFRDPGQQASLVTSLQVSGDWHAWQQRFLNFSQRVIVHLRSGQLAPRQAPACVVRGYRRGLETGNAPLSAWTELLCRPWADAWEWLGQPQGFQADALRVFDRAVANPANLGVQVLAALCHASVSFWDPIPAKVLAGALQRGVVSQAQALALLPHPDWYQELREETIATIYPLLSEPFAAQVSTELEGIDLEELEEGEPLLPSSSMNRLSPEDAEQQLAYYELSRAEYPGIDQRMYASCDLLEKLPDSLLERGIDLWLKETQADWPFPTAIIPRLPDELVEKVLSIGQAMRFSSNPRAVDVGIEVLNGLLDRVSSEALRSLIEAHRFTFVHSSLGSTVSDLPDGVVLALLEELQTVQRGEEYAESIDEIARILRQREEKGDQPASMFEKPPDQAQPEILKQDLSAALHEARTIKYPSGRISALAKLAAGLAEPERRPIVEEAIAMLPHLNDSKQTADAITQLAPLLSPDQADPLLDLARNLPVEESLFDGYGMWSRSETCLALASSFIGARRREIQEEAIRLARQESSSFRRAIILNHLAPALPIELRYGILEGIWELDYNTPDYSTWSNVHYMIRHLTIGWEEMCRAAGADPYAALSRTLRAFAHAPRWLLSLSLEYWLPIIYQMGGTHAAIEAVRADIDVGIWWP